MTDDDRIIAADEELLEALGLTAEEAVFAAQDLPAPVLPNRAQRRAALRGTHAGSKGHKHKRTKSAFGRPESTREGAVVHAIVRRHLKEKDSEEESA